MHKIPVTNTIVILQMQNSLLDLLRSSLIPELRSDISAGTSCNIQCILVAVSAMWTLPYELSFLICYNLDLSVISTLLTVIALCIEFRIHNVVINETAYADKYFLLEQCQISSADILRTYRLYFQSVNHRY